ncbi:MAG: hypothetical protein ACLFQJ_03610 [Campylobacterales bacterium]
MLHIKKYFIFSVILLALLAGGFYYLHKESLNLYFLGLQLSLPFGIWMIVSGSLLLFFTLLHLWYHGAKLYFIKKRYHKDYEALLSKIESKLSGKDSDVKIKNDEFRALSSVLDRLYLAPNPASPISGVENIDSIFSQIKSIEEGEYIDTKSILFAKENPFFTKNLKNRVKNDHKYLNEVLKKGPEENKELFSFAFSEALKNDMAKEVKASWSKLSNKDTSIALDILHHISSNKEVYNFEVQEIESLLKHFDFSSNEYIKIARELKSSLTPDELLKLYENLSSEDEKAEDSYIYVLFDLEMLDEASLRAQNATSENIEKFKAYKALKDEGRHIGLEVFF